MSIVTVPQAQPGDELTDNLINRGSNAIATVVNGQLDDTNITSLSGTKITGSSIPSSALNDSGNIELYRQESGVSYVASGLVWSALTGLNGAMSSGVFYTHLGVRTSVSAIATRAFTASKDTYVSISNGTVAYSEVANGATAPNLPANSIWLSKVVTSGAAITSATDIRPTSNYPITSRQNITTNIKAAMRVETGWGYLLGNNTIQMTQGVTFASPFSIAPIVVCSFSGYSSTAPTSNTGNLQDNSPYIFSPQGTTITGTTINMTRSSSVFSPTLYYIYNWIAIGI